MNWGKLLDLAANSKDIAALIKNPKYWKMTRDGVRQGPLTSIDVGFDGRPWVKFTFTEDSKEHNVQVWDGWPSGDDEIVFDGASTDSEEVSIRITTAGINLAIIVKFRFAYEGGTPEWRLDGHFPIWKFFH